MSSLPPPPCQARNVLLIVWDTVRAGNLSLHGYGRRTSPNLERLAGRGVRFDQAFATAPWTLPSHSSLFTGRWPHELTADWQSPLDGTYPTLAEYLGRARLRHGRIRRQPRLLQPGDRPEPGLRALRGLSDRARGMSSPATSAWVAGSTCSHPASVIEPAAEEATWATSYDVIPRSKEHAKDAAAVDRAFLAWLSWQRTRGRPFFAFLNYNDAHSPYEVPDRSIPAFGLRPTSYVDRLTLKSWDTLDKSKLSIRSCPDGKRCL